MTSETCPECKGSGKILLLVSSVDCDRCLGTGRIVLLTPKQATGMILDEMNIPDDTRDDLLIIGGGPGGGFNGATGPKYKGCPMPAPNVGQGSVTRTRGSAAAYPDCLSGEPFDIHKAYPPDWIVDHPTRRVYSPADYTTIQRQRAMIPADTVDKMRQAMKQTSFTPPPPAAKAMPAPIKKSPPQGYKSWREYDEAHAD